MIDAQSASTRHVGDDEAPAARVAVDFVEGEGRTFTFCLPRRR